jgi:FtsH-binding integral membrane protein
MAASDLVVPPPTPRIMDYPASIGLVIAVVLTVVLVIAASKFDKTGGTLTVSLLVILAFLGLVTFCALFTIPTDEITSGAIGGLVAAFGAVVAYWLSRGKGPSE